MKKQVYLMRHGQTVFNERGKLQGWCDAPLTDLGIYQAKMAKKYFEAQKITFDAAYCSTSERASDTLELISDQNYTRLKGLREWSFGLYEGENHQLCPTQPFEDFFVPYGGESEQEVRQRMSETMSKLMSTCEGEHVLIVSHGVASTQFTKAWQHLSQVPPLPGIKNCSVLTFEYDTEDQTFTLLTYHPHDFSDYQSK